MLRRSALVCHLLAATVLAAPLGAKEHLLDHDAMREVFEAIEKESNLTDSHDSDASVKTSDMADLITLLDMLMKPGFSDFLHSLTDEEKQAVDLSIWTTKPTQLDALGAEAKAYVDETADYTNSTMEDETFWEDISVLLAKYEALSAKAKADLSEHYEKHTKLIHLNAFYMKAKPFYASNYNSPPQVFDDGNIRRLFGKQGICSYQLKYDDPQRAEATGFFFFHLNVQSILTRPHHVDFLKSLTDLDKQLIKDYMAAENSHEGCINYWEHKINFEEANFEDANFEEVHFANLSTAVTNLYREMETAIEIPHYIDPETKEFAKEARKILAHYDALSVEDKAAFQGAFPAIKGHIDGIRLFFKFHSYLKLYPRTHLFPYPSN